MPQHPANCPLRWRLSNGLGVYLSWLQAGFSGHLMTLFYLIPADFRRFLTVLVDRRLLGSQCCLSTGLVANKAIGRHIPLYCSQPTGEKTDTNHQCERLAKIRQTTGNIWSWVSVFSPVGWLQYSGIWRPIALKDIPVVCMPIICHLCAFDIRLRTVHTESLNVHCWQIDIDDHVWHGV
jgi:hypothetical protein